jgi:hypothetical protein
MIYFIKVYLVRQSKKKAIKILIVIMNRSIQVVIHSILISVIVVNKVLMKTEIKNIKKMVKMTTKSKKLKLEVKSVGNKKEFSLLALRKKLIKTKNRLTLKIKESYNNIVKNLMRQKSVDHNVMLINLQKS